MALIADFCYNIPISERLTTSNIGHVLCASSYLQMTGPKNLLRLCRSKLEELTKGGLCDCLDVLVNCMDVSQAAEQEDVTKCCVEAAARHWKDAGWSSSWSASFCARRSVSQIGQLPVSWAVLILEKLQTSNCLAAMRTYVASSYLDSVMGRYTEMTQNCIVYPMGDMPSSSQNSSTTNHGNCSASCGDSVEGLQPVGERDDEGQNSKEQNPGSLATVSELASKEQPQPKASCAEISSLPDSQYRTQDLTAVLQTFDIVTGYIPEKGATYGARPAGWFAACLRFAYKHGASQNSIEHFTSMCLSVFEQLKFEDIQDMTPGELARINEVAHGQKRKQLSMHVLKLTDQYLYHRAVQATIDSSQFALLLSSNSFFSRASFDQVYNALDVMLVSQHVSDASILDIIQHIDFTKLSQSIMEKASTNSRIPCEVLLKAAVIVCAQQREKVASKEKVILELSSQKDELSSHLSSQIRSLQLQLKETRERPPQELQGTWITASDSRINLASLPRAESTAGWPDELIAMDITSGNSSDVSPAVREADSTSNDSRSNIRSNVGVGRGRLKLRASAASGSEFLLNISRKPHISVQTQQQITSHYSSYYHHHQINYASDLCRTNAASETFLTVSGFFMPLQPKTLDSSHIQNSISKMLARPGKPKANFPAFLMYDMSSDTLYTTGKLTRWIRKEGPIERDGKN